MLTDWNSVRGWQRRVVTAGETICLDDTCQRTQEERHVSRNDDLCLQGVGGDFEAEGIGVL